MSASDTSLRASKRRELGTFVFLAAFLAPLVTLLLICGYGFVVWVWHMIHGPPGPAVS
jgi:periplasmic nitrate reductase NapE